jgi:hypothetical protein
VALPEGELVVNSSQGGGSKDTWVISPPRPLPDDGGGPDLTRIEFTSADLPEDPPAQDPGPVAEAALAQSQQQQQTASVQGPSASVRAPGGTEVLPLAPLDTRQLAPSLRARPTC